MGSSPRTRSLHRCLVAKSRGSVGPGGQASPVKYTTRKIPGSLVPFSWAGGVGPVAGLAGSLLPSSGLLVGSLWS